MPDNIALPASGVTAATDDIGGIHYQRIKVGYGPDGSYTDATPETGLPVASAAASTCTVTSVAASVTSVTLLAANTSRARASVYNDSTADLYLKLGAVASATDFTLKMAPGGYYEIPDPVWRGVIDGIWSTANGAARVTELV